jgi:hypothetical protein
MNRPDGLLRAFAALLTCALVSCGGGGGGGGSGGGGSNGPLVTADGSSFDMVALLPNAATSNTVIFTLHDDSSKTTYYAEVKSDVSDAPAHMDIRTDGTAAVTIEDNVGTGPAGSQSGTVTFKLCTDDQCNGVAWTQSYPLHYTRFQVDMTPLTLTAGEGGSTSQVLQLTPPDTGHLLSVTAGYNDALGGWLSGTHDASGNLVLTASAVGIPAGSYSAQVSVAAAPLGNYMLKSVAFNVGAGLFAPALADIVERVDSTTASFQGSGSIGFAGPGAAWTATSDSAWLVVDTLTGTGAGSLRYHVDAAAADAAIGNWSSATANIKLTSPGMTDATSTLTYRRQLPEIAMVSPSQIWPGQAATLRVTGRGLSQLTGVGQIQVGSQGVASGTIDSDVHATLQLTPQAAGSLQVGIANALHVASAQANVAVAAGRLAYAAVPTAGAKNAIVYDPSRQAVFASDDDASTLLRWKLSGSTWAVTAIPWAGIWRVQLSPDRSTLYVLDKGTLSELDPDTLATRATHVGWTWSGIDFADALPITSDLRMWLPESGTQYFDLRTHAFAFAPADEFGIGDLTTMIATPDGAYLYSVGQSSPNGWYSAATQTNTPLPPTVLQYNYSASFDLDGGFGLFDWQSVYHTGSWTLAGSATLPGTETGSGGVISPDGTRVYRLAGPYSAYTQNVNHVDVFDTTQLQPGTSQFVQIGTIAVADDAVNCSDPECDVTGRLVIDPLGSTLFWVGNQNFVVIPIPASMAGVAGAKGKSQRLQPSSAMAMQRR